MIRKFIDLLILLGGMYVNEITKSYIEIGIIKDLYDEKVISKEEMDLAILEIKRKSNIEEMI